MEISNEKNRRRQQNATLKTYGTKNQPVDSRHGSTSGTSQHNRSHQRQIYDAKGGSKETAKKQRVE